MCLVSSGWQCSLEFSKALERLNLGLQGSHAPLSLVRIADHVLGDSGQLTRQPLDHPTVVFGGGLL